MLQTFRALLALTLTAMTAGCSGLGRSPSAPVLPQAVPNGAVTSHEITWGIGLSGFISLQIPKGLTEDNFVKSFCQSKKPGGCAVFTLGARSSHVALAKTLGWSGGTFSVDDEGNSSFGAFSFHHYVDSTSKSQHVFQGSETNSQYDWSDYLKIESSSHGYGSPAKFEVTMKVSPVAIMLHCNANNVESFTFHFDSNGSPGNYKSVNGGCVGTKFKVYVNDPAHPGTTTKTIVSGTVGQNLNIEGMGSVVSALCQPTGCIRQTSILTGTVRYTIKSLTPGVTYKAASGTKYS